MGQGFGIKILARESWKESDICETEIQKLTKRFCLNKREMVPSFSGSLHKKDVLLQPKIHFKQNLNILKKMIKIILSD